MNSRRTAVTLAIIAVLAHQPVRAQSPGNAQSTQDGRSDEARPDPAFSETVVVTASRVPQSKSESPTSVTVLSEEDIQRSAARSVDELLREVPGFSLLRQAPGFASQPSTRATSVRGLGGGNSRTLALVDGVPLNDPFSGIIYWSRIPLDNIDRVEIVKSGASGAWGNLALGGVINVITKTPQAQPSFFLDVDGGNEQTGNIAAGVRQSHGPVSASLTGSFFRTDGYITLRPDFVGPVDRPTDDRTGSVNGRLRYQPSPGTTWDIGADFFSERQHFGTPLSKDSTHIGSASSRLNRVTSDGSTWTVAGYVSHQNGTNSSSSVAADRRSETPATNQFDVPATAVGTNLQWSKPITASQVVSVGADTQWVDAATNEGFNFAAGVLSRLRNSRGHQFFAGLYAEDLWQPAARWRVVASARIDRWRSTDAARLETDIATETVLRDDAYPDRTEVTVNPSLGIVMRAAKAVSIRGSVYRGFRAPTSVEMLRPFRARGNVVTESNAELAPERLTGGEAGLDLTLFNRLQVHETGFWDDLSDAITTRTIAEAGATTRTIPPCGVVPAGGVCRQRQNVGRLRSRGLESDVRYRGRSGWGASLTYLFDPSRVVDNPLDPSLVGRFNKLSPVHQLTATASYESARWFEASVAIRSIGSSFEDDVNSLPLRRFTLVDIRVSRPLTERADAFLSIQNVTGQAYEISRGTDGTVGIGAPRLVRAGLRIHF